ncbi:hypothetical protein N657DRAFT_646099 [Parathielavia appendiculata]|uniref:Uncharacterized protein n=1 Tax=Parathielavia appendiculata TaxID=2587402 RepID=A0AAN6TZC8_9PEZI|nr:hypothetical protein N657DRAFT_646099 [Parathielavia appendiculata]
MPPTPTTALPSMAKQSTPKTMSSRLMTMKFMQRAAASQVVNTPKSTSPATPQSDDGSAKRRKVSHTSSAASGSPATPLYDQKAIQAALKEEEKKRQAAIEKRAAELGDSHWELPSAASLRKRAARPALSVVQVGFAQIDYASASAREDGGGGDDSFDSGSVPGQVQIRGFNMKKSEACLQGKGIWAVSYAC